MKFRGRPIEVEAIQFTGRNFKECSDFAKEHYHLSNGGTFYLLIPNRDWMAVFPGEWIVRDVMGHCYPVEAAAFEKSYESA